MIRIIVRSDYADMAVNVGGAVESEFKTFDISAPELEAYLSRKLPSQSSRFVVGVERLTALAVPPHDAKGGAA
jgi:hypothetical protein